MAGFKVQNEENGHYRPLLWVIGLLVVLFFLWASHFEIDQRVRAVGRIIPAGHSKTVQHLEGGIVSDINVVEGQRVVKGDVLLQVNNQRALSGLEEQKIALLALQIRLARLQSEYQGKEKFVVILEDLGLDAGGQNKTDQSQITDMIQSEKRLFSSRRQALNEKTNVFQEQIRQKQLRLEELQAQFTNIKAEREIAQQQLDINEKLKRSGAISESRYLDTKSRVRSFDTRIDQVRKTIPITQAELEEVSIKITSEKESFSAEITNEISQIELGIQKLSERIKGGYDEVKRTAILSPATGIVNKLYVNTKGGVVQPGQSLIEIIPLEDNLVIEAKVLTKDRGMIWFGLPAVIKVSAYDFAIYGGVKGTVADISADSFIADNGTAYYRTRIMLNSNTMPDNSPLYPGMTVDVNIISGKTTILHALLKRFWRLQENALREA